MGDESNFSFSDSISCLISLLCTSFVIRYLCFPILYFTCLDPFPYRFSSVEMCLYCLLTSISSLFSFLSSFILIPRLLIIRWLEYLTLDSSEILGGEGRGSTVPKNEFIRYKETIEPQSIVFVIIRLFSFYVFNLPSILPFSIALTSFTNQESSRTDSYTTTDTLY